LSCGGALVFDSGARKMSCRHCDSEFELADVEDYQSELEAHPEEGLCWSARSREIEAWENGGLGELESGSCPSCGAELVGGQNAIAMVCPFCGNAQIVKSRISGLLKPDCVIPFRLDKAAAAGALESFCQGKRLLPDGFREKPARDMSSVYVPFWLFDARARGHLRFRATKTRSWSDAAYNYTKTDYYSVVRDGELSFEKIPVSACDKLSGGRVEAIEPFDYGDLKDFSPAFLSGHAAEKFDLSVDKCREAAGARIKESVERQFAGSVSGYSSVTTESSSVEVTDDKASYGLLPAWTLNVRHDGKTHFFMVNGQTGALAGILPVDRRKCWKYGILIFLISGAALSLGALALWRFLDIDFLPMAIAAWACALVVGLSVVGSWKGAMSRATGSAAACDYASPGSLSFREKKDRFLYSKVVKVRRQQQPSGGRRRR